LLITYFTRIEQVRVAACVVM